MGQTFSTRNEALFRTSLSDTQRVNSELNHQEYLRQSMVLASRPRRLVFELTNRCNFHCIMCGREAAQFTGCDLPLAVIQRFEPWFPHIEEVTLHGWGEGTLHPEFTAILAYLNRFPTLRKYFVTNGSTLDHIAEPVFRHHVDLIALSLDGASAATNDGIRKNGSLERQLASLRRLLAEKQRRGLDYPYVNFVFTAMRRNLAELPAMVDLAHQLGVPEIKVVYLTIFTPELLAETLLDRQAEVRAVFAEARHRAESRGIKLKLPEIQGEGEAGAADHRTCPFPWRDLYVGSDGQLRPCQSSPLQLGSVLEGESLQQVWNSPAMQALRRGVNDEVSMPAGCRRCYHSSSANYNLPHSFVQMQLAFAPSWGQQTEAEPAPAVAVGDFCLVQPTAATN
ncbi:MAG: radical SAM protein [Desulfuromonadales bacterium]|nr:radical SAM protein [Desulfuromonadales bacterium]